MPPGDPLDDTRDWTGDELVSLRGSVGFIPPANDWMWGSAFEDLDTHNVRGRLTVTRGGIEHDDSRNYKIPGYNSPLVPIAD